MLCKRENSPGRPPKIGVGFSVYLYSGVKAAPNYSPQIAISRPVDTCRSLEQVDMRQTLRSADPSRFAVWAQALLNGSNQLWLSDLAGGRRTTYQIYECAFRLRPGAQRNLQRTL